MQYQWSTLSYFEVHWWCHTIISTICHWPTHIDTIYNPSQTCRPHVSYSYCKNPSVEIQRTRILSHTPTRFASSLLPEYLPGSFADGLSHVSKLVFNSMNAFPPQNAPPKRGDGGGTEAKSFGGFRWARWFWQVRRACELDNLQQTCESIQYLQPIQTWSLTMLRTCQSYRALRYLPNLFCIRSPIIDYLGVLRGFVVVVVVAVVVVRC